MKIMHVVGARPNFMKLAPVYKAFFEKNIIQIIVHTGQHYSSNMSDIFFEELGIPNADINLGVGSGSQAEQVAKIMIAFEKVLIESKPDLVVVYGDINSTMAASLVCAKLQVKFAHVEAGLRSFDLSMPEEINRMVTDRLADIFLTPSIDANHNLEKEGADKNKIYFVGNVMIDTLVSFLDKKSNLDINLPDKYAVVTLHRPSNVDDIKVLENIVNSLIEISHDIKIYFSVHPRTKEKLEVILNDKGSDMVLLDPLGYIEFLNLVKNSLVVITDSGGIQEETTFLGIPCLTLRDNTERPITTLVGTNTLVGNNFKLLKEKVREVLDNKYKKGEIPQLWDGNASKRIADIIIDLFNKS